MLPPDAITLVDDAQELASGEVAKSTGNPATIAETDMKTLFFRIFSKDSFSKGTYYLSESLCS